MPNLDAQQSRLNHLVEVYFTIMSALQYITPSIHRDLYGRCSRKLSLTISGLKMYCYLTTKNVYRHIDIALVRLSVRKHLTFIQEDFSQSQRVKGKLFL